MHMCRYYWYLFKMTISSEQHVQSYKNYYCKSLKELKSNFSESIFKEEDSIIQYDWSKLITMHNTFDYTEETGHKELIRI